MRGITHYVVHHLPRELALAFVAAVMYEALHETMLSLIGVS